MFTNIMQKIKSVTPVLRYFRKIFMSKEFIVINHTVTAVTIVQFSFAQEWRLEEILILDSFHQKMAFYL